MISTSFVARIGKPFQVYDGFIFPSEEWQTCISNFTYNTKITTKNSWRHALITFLNQLPFRSAELNISSLCDEICCIYFHMKWRFFVPFNAGSTPTSFCNAEELNVGLQQVSIILLLYDCMYVCSVHLI